jgi:hypothetical protein
VAQKRMQDNNNLKKEINSELSAKVDKGINHAI